LATLIADVTARFSNDLLVKLTNVDSQTLTVVNTTFLQSVCDDVQTGEFEAHMNDLYDSTNRAHIVFAVLLVKLKCIEYGASADETADKLRDRIQKLALALCQVGPRDRVSPQSSSDLTPSVHSGPGPFRPAFDDIFFERMTPEDTSSDRDPITGFPLP
jgi:hypothetical protein